MVEVATAATKPSVGHSRSELKAYVMIGIGWESTLVAGEKVAQGKLDNCGCSEVAVASMVLGRGDNC